LCQLVLCDAGHSVEIMTNGHKALERAAQGNLDLVVLDWVMPDMDGGVLTARLKAQPQTKGLPVLAMSALRDGESRAALAGADAFLAKPFGADELVRAVCHALSPLTAKERHRDDRQGDRHRSEKNT
jgi:two-component system sensor histidine kinase/response regulator